MQCFKISEVVQLLGGGVVTARVWNRNDPAKWRWEKVSKMGGQGISLFIQVGTEVTQNRGEWERGGCRRGQR